MAPCRKPSTTPFPPPLIASLTSPASFGIPLALPGLLILSVDLLTEQGPAISLAYEPAESALMRVPPRDLARDRLVDGRLLRYAYLLAGLATTGACLLAYFLVMLIGGVSGSDLWQASARGYFQSADSPPFRTAAGATLSGSQQLELVNAAHAAYYFNLVLCQAWVNLYLCKTRVVSLCTHGPLTNASSAAGSAAAMLIALFFVFMPFLQGVFASAALTGYCMFMWLLFAAVMLPYTVSALCRRLA